MVRTALSLDRSFDTCEAEEIRRTGIIQSGVVLVARDAAGHVWSTMQPGDARAQLCALAKADREPIAPPYAIVRDADGRRWLNHVHEGASVYERPLTGPNGAAGAPLPRLGERPDVVAGAERVATLCHIACREISQALGAERTMVYRFHDDWSGEVIAETVSGDLEPFIGLRYPATDIPGQARSLYLATRSRHILTTARSPEDLHTDAPAKEPIDLSFAMSRSVSPFHIEYLRNMGSASTASAAIVVDGRLWGLVSLHFSGHRAASLDEFIYLQQVSSDLSSLVAGAVQAEAAEAERRADRLLDRFSAALAEGADPVRTVLFGESAWRRMLSAQGVALVAGDRMIGTGRIPDRAALARIAERLEDRLAPGAPYFTDALGPELPDVDLAGSAGLAAVRLAADPDCVLFLFREAVSQSITWGGDPRRIPAPADIGRYSPRKSFSQWVETVEGKAVSWSTVHRTLLTACARRLLDHFGSDTGVLARCVARSLADLAADPEDLRRALDRAVTGVHSTITLAVEYPRARPPTLLATNSAAKAAFDIVTSVSAQQPLAVLERLSGISLPQAESERSRSPVLTLDRGERELEIVGDTYAALWDSVDGPPAISFAVFEMRDVTEAARIERSLLAARQRAEDDARLRQLYLAKLNHELRTPLNVLVGFSDLLMASQASVLGDADKRRLDLIRRAGQHMVHMVSNALDNASAVYHTPTADRSPFDLGKLIEECAEFMAAQAAMEDVTIEVTEGHPIELVSDVKAVRQVILNLMANAIKYNMRGGQVSLRTQATNADEVCISISDTGIGMSDEQISGALQDFRRFGEGPGTGLGLSIVSQLLSMLGGSMTIASQPSQGTTVRVVLPMAPATARDHHAV